MWGLLVAFMTIAAGGLEVRGTVTSLDGKESLYTEVHTITRDEKGLNQRIETQYLKPDGTPIGRMTSDFTKSKTVPVIVFEDFRFQIKEDLRWSEDGKQVCLRSEQPLREAKEKCFKPHAEMVAGQGFDNFVKLNFKRLREETLPLRFGVLSELDFFSFKGHVKSAAGEVPVRFGIRISNVFLRLFLDELVVEYDPVTLELLSYRGLSNLKSDKAKAQKVAIQYKVTKP